jgi:integral membrane sensor domain MASE1/serine phosphatase RsbU (regulator of sigma subunit)/anti-sigma regulatory factor (Ser/Thr protein kinase)
MIAAVYFTAGRVGLLLALVGGQVTPLWPPTGVALVCLLVWGLRMWPGVTLGAFLVNPLAPSVLVALGISAGNTLAPVCACLLLRRTDFRVELNRLRDALALVFLGALTGMLISATAGAGALALAGAIPASKFRPTWLVWWTGDAMGVLVVAPFLLVLRRTRWLRGSSPYRWVEAGVMLASTAVVTLVATRSTIDMLFFAFPFLIWAAIRFQLAGAAPCSLIVSMITIIAAADDTGPFKGRQLSAQMFILQAFNGTIALTALSLSVLITERNLARERLALLNEASSRIGSTLDVVCTAEELVEVAVSGYADWVSVDLLDAVYGGGEPPPGREPGPVVLRRAAYRHFEGVPGVVPFGRVGTYPEFSPPARCLATGRPIQHRITDPEIVRWLGEDRARAALTSEHGLHSVMFVPLRARGINLGVVVFGRHARLDRFEPDDLLLAGELAAKAAMAIDNARRYTRERTVALALQRSLLPQRLPDQPAVELASRYRPAEFGVGGDWYDVIPLSGARVALVVGDVVGHGIQAAATMGRLRTAVRTLAAGELPPEELLTRLDDVLTRLTVGENLTPGVAISNVDIDENIGIGETGDIGATCLYAVYDPVTRRCSLARAGHPPPAAVTPDGKVTFLEVPAGPPLGLGLGLGLDALPYEAIDIDLPTGTLLALYTDGLIESRDHDIDEGLHELRRLLATPAPTLDAACKSVLDALLPDHPADDTALLLARTRALDDHQVAFWALSADPASVAHARAQSSVQLAAWGLGELAFTTELVVSELVTNAIRHGRGPIGLRLIRTNILTCEVSDTGGAAPHLRQAGTLDENGRGLLLVARLTHRWGSRPTTDGKTIWAEL